MTQRNWLEVYPYSIWGGNANLPALEVGQQFMPSVMELKEVRTCTRTQIIHVQG